MDVTQQVYKIRWKIEEFHREIKQYPSDKQDIGSGSNWMTKKYPSDADEAITRKYPSDGDDEVPPDFFELH